MRIEARSAESPEGERDHDAAQHRAQRRIGDPSLDKPSELVRRGRKHEADETENHTSDHDGSDAPRRHRDHLSDRVVHVVHAPGHADLVGHDASDHAGQ